MKARPPPWKAAVPGIVAVYVVVGVLWILFSDTLLLLGGDLDAEQAGFWSLVKGLCFVLVTGAVLAVILSRSLRRERVLDWRLQLVLNNSSDGIWLLDVDGRTVWVNPRMEHMLGLDLKALSGHSMLDHVAVASQAQLSTLLKQRAAGALAPFSAELRGAHGRVIKVNCRVIPIVDGAGDYGGACAFVTDRSEAHDALQALSVRQQAIEQMPIALTLVDALAPDMPLIYANPEFYRMTGTRPEQVIGRNCRFLQGEDRDQAGLRELRAAMSSGQPCTVTLRNYHADGSAFQNQLTVVPVRDAEGALTHFAGIQRDISFRLMLRQRVEKLAYEDELTGLRNRVAFTEHLNENREQLAGWAVLVTDAERLRDINATRGHAAGDKLLRALSERMQQQLQPGEVCARAGGDEFAVLLRGNGNAEHLHQRANRLLQALTTPIDVDGSELRMRISGGLALINEDSDAEAVIDRAEAAAHVAKEMGGVEAVVYDEAMRNSHLYYIRTTQDLALALAANQFELYYEPKLNLKDGTIIGAEALLRWHHPRDGLQRPGGFIGIAEASGLIVPIGRWVIESACVQLRRWLDGGRRSMKLSINVSRLQLDQPDFVSFLADAVARHRIPAGMLCVELTESLLMDESGRLRKQLDAIRRLGVELSIDDFGTGYSSLGYLQSFAVDELKIDRRFTSGLPAERYALAIVPMMIGLGHALGLRVTAEGVETESQRDWLRSHGCDQAQGYLYSQPRNAADFEQLLQHGVSLVAIADDQQSLP